MFRLKQGLEEGESERGVCVIEMGHTQTTIFVFRLSSEGVSRLATITATCVFLRANECTSYR
jgi:hypothetical protein